MPIITEFSPDAARLAVLKDCIDNYDVGEDESAEWPNNILSRQTVVYGNGTIARAGDDVSFAVDSDELDLCVRLASEATALMEGEEVGMDSESSAGFSPFWICANGEETTRVDENLIRARFGNTIFPPATIRIGALNPADDPFEAVFAGLEEAKKKNLTTRNSLKRPPKSGARSSSGSSHSPTSSSASGSKSATAARSGKCRKKSIRPEPN